MTSAASSGWKVMDKGWERVQAKTFTKWTNNHLKRRFGAEVQISDPATSFEDGLMVMHIMNALYDAEMPKRYTKVCRNRINQLDNITLALEMVEKAGVKTNFLKNTHLVDHDLKMILGMLWSFILDYQIKGISVEELSAKEGLLLWCQKKTQGYQGVKVQNFHTSWVDGLAFCALIHRHRPDLIDFDSLSSKNKKENLELAFKVAEEKLGIPALLDAEDLIDTARPDEKSVMCQVSEYFLCFAAQNQGETAGRRIATVLKITQSNDAFRDDYVSKAKELVAWIKMKTNELVDPQWDNTLEGILSRIQQFSDYKSSEKPEKLVAKLQMEQIYTNLLMKLRANKRPIFVPEEGLSVGDIDQLWNSLGSTELSYEKLMYEELQRQQKLDFDVRVFNQKAKALGLWGEKKVDVLTALSNVKIGTLNEVQAHMKIMEAFDLDFEAANPRLESIVGLGNQIIEEKYHSPDILKTKMEELSSNLWKKLMELSQVRKDGLQKELELQIKMEEHRKAFAVEAKEVDRWLKDTAEDIKDFNFGSTLERVLAYAEKLEKNEEELRSSYETKLASLENNSNNLVEVGVKDNRYTILNVESIVSRFETLKSLFAERRAAYEEELKRQEAMEDARKTYAEEAGNFVSWVLEQKQAIVEIQGDPEERKEAIVQLFADGKHGVEKLSALKVLDENCSNLKVGFNKHTDYTYNILEKKWSSFQGFFKNYITSLEEDIVMKAQELLQSKEWEEKANLEEKKIGFAKDVSDFAKWIQETLDILNFPIKVNSIPEIEDLIREFKELVAAKTLKNEEKDRILGLDVELKELGVTENVLSEMTSEEIVTRWNEVTESFESREQALNQEQEKQNNNETLRLKFAELANVLNIWLNESISSVSKASGELEEQLEGMHKAGNDLFNRKPDLEEVLNAWQALADAHVRDNKHTELTNTDIESIWNLAESTVAEKKKLLEGELMLKKGSEVSAEQLEELKESFAHFDKNSDGTFNSYEFKACLSSLGENFSDEQILEVMKEYGDVEKMSFDIYVEFMVKRLTDNTTEEEFIASFQVLAGEEKEFVTETELIPVMEPEFVEYLKSNMPMTEDGSGYDFKKFSSEIFSR